MKKLLILTIFVLALSSVFFIYQNKSVVIDGFNVEKFILDGDDTTCITAAKLNLYIDVKECEIFLARFYEIHRTSELDKAKLDQMVFFQRIEGGYDGSYTVYYTVNYGKDIVVRGVDDFPIYKNNVFLSKEDIITLAPTLESAYISPIPSSLAYESVDELEKDIKRELLTYFPTRIYVELTSIDQTSDPIGIVSGNGRFSGCFKGTINLVTKEANFRKGGCIMI